MNPIEIFAYAELDSLVTSMVGYTAMSGIAQKSSWMTPTGLVSMGTATGNGDMAIAVIYPAAWAHEDHQPGDVVKQCFSNLCDPEVTEQAIDLATSAYEEVLAGTMRPIPVA